MVVTAPLSNRHQWSIGESASISCAGLWKSGQRSRWTAFDCNYQSGSFVQSGQSARVLSDAKQSEVYALFRVVPVPLHDEIITEHQTCASFESLRRRRNIATNHTETKAKWTQRTWKYQYTRRGTTQTPTDNVLPWLECTSTRMGSDEVGKCEGPGRIATFGSEEQCFWKILRLLLRVHSTVAVYELGFSLGQQYAGSIRWNAKTVGLKNQPTAFSIAPNAPGHLHWGLDDELLLPSY